MSASTELRKVRTCSHGVTAPTEDLANVCAECRHSMALRFADYLSDAIRKRDDINSACYSRILAKLLNGQSI